MTQMTHRFISLKWKTALLFSVILLIFNASLPVLVYWVLQQKFDFSRKHIQQQYQQDVIGQLRTTSLQIQQLAEISLLQYQTRSQILEAIANNKSKLSLDWHISTVRLLDLSGQPLGGWGQLDQPVITAALENTLRKEKPQSRIYCQSRCRQYELIPVLQTADHNDLKYILVIAYDMSHTLLNFSQKHHADIGVLTDATNRPADNPEHVLPQWNMIISGLTGYAQNSVYLHRLAEQRPFQRAIVRVDTLPVEFNFFSLKSQPDVIFVVMDNIAEQRQEIIAITKKSVLLSLLGFILLSGGLFIFISRPLSRLSVVSHALPLLAQQQYHKVRQLIRPRKSAFSHDELDQLEHSTLTLTAQLEQLDHSLQARSQTLQQERDLLTSLLNTAQVMIITLDKQCRMTSFNDFAEQVTGYHEQEMIQTDFRNLFPDEVWKETEITLQHLKQHPRAAAQQESHFIHKNGSLRLISWLYSSLAHPTESTVILAVGRDVTEKRKDESHILWLAEHDTLTHLYNRYKFTAELERIHAYSEELHVQGALLTLDLDQFKDINDRFGHPAGDYVLRQTANFLRDHCRETDIIGRLSGDEFAIILPETSENGALALARHITAELKKLTLVYQEQHFRLSASIGIVTFPLANLTVAELLSNANLAMHDAKSQGKNTWSQFKLDSNSRQQLEKRFFWKQKIEDALDNDGFIFHYQPIMDIRSRKISHYEMLIRMRDQDGQLYYPGSFIEIAEQTGLIRQIDHFVLRKGIAKQAQLDKAHKNVSISINLSAYAIDDKALLPMIETLLHQHQVSADHLIFELTETAAVADLHQAKKLMQAVTELGCRFSIDDFGTGFASFHYMRELPVDIVKIDGAFIANIADNVDDQLFVKAMVDVAKGMGKKTVAEFVESKEALALLHTFGVDYAQGYYIGKPAADLLDNDPLLP